MFAPRRVRVLSGSLCAYNAMSALKLASRSSSDHVPFHGSTLISGIFLAMHGAQACPREVGHAAGRDRGRFVRSRCDPAAARVLGHADDRVCQELAMFVFE